jgi:hypothetical protein
MEILIGVHFLSPACWNGWEHVLATITRLVPGVSVLSSWYDAHLDTSRNARIYPFGSLARLRLSAPV